MNALEKVRQWVQTFPKWEEGQLLYIDYTAAVPGNTGLYPMGMKVLGSQEDILGGVTVRCCYQFALYRVVSGQEDRDADAEWLLAFQEWVQQQSVLGYAPTFGDVPGQETIRAEKGRLKEGSQAGTGIYCVELTAEFVKKY